MTSLEDKSLHYLGSEGAGTRNDSPTIFPAGHLRPTRRDAYIDVNRYTTRFITTDLTRIHNPTRINLASIEVNIGVDRK